MAVDFPAIKAFSAASFEPFTKGLEAIAAETTDYSKKGCVANSVRGRSGHGRTGEVYAASE
jgi:hypothetical protein